MNSVNNIKPSAKALIPFLVFIGIYLGMGIYYQVNGVELAFYQFPSVTAMFIAVLTAFCMSKGTINEKFEVFAKGAANINILTMLMIYVLAGGFANTAAAMGGRDATVNLGLSLVPVGLLAAGIFLISAFMGTATGTSMGTISAVIPLAVGVAEKGGLSLPVVVGACVGGAMFGDNLSMISDTTIAATRTQNCEMRDKFKVNLLIALPAAIITVIVLLIVGRPQQIVQLENLDFNLVKVLPYLLVLFLAIAGINVFICLTTGVLSAGIIGLVFGDFTLASLATAVWEGFTSMNEVFFLTLFCGGMAEMIAKNGGIAFIITALRGVIRGNRSAQVGIAAMASLCDIATANNTIAIIVAGTMAKDMSAEYRVDPRRSASLLDIFACVFQGIVPYGAQVITAAALTNATITNMDNATSPVSLIPYMWYCWILAGFGIASIFIPFADRLCKKDPWDYERDCPQSLISK